MAYMQALSGDPANVDWKEGLLGICIDGKQFTRAESLVKNLIKEQPTDTRYWLTYANILIAEGRKTEATVILETASGAGISNTETLTLLGDLYAEQNMVREAGAIYQKVLVPSPEVGERKLIHYAQVLIATNKLQEAQGVLGMLANPGDDPTGIEIRQTRADLLAAQKKWAQAREELDGLLKIAPLNGRALISLGRAYDERMTTSPARPSLLSRLSASRTAPMSRASSFREHRAEEPALRQERGIPSQKALSIEKTDDVQDFLVRVKTLVPRDG